MKWFVVVIVLSLPGEPSVSPPKEPVRKSRGWTIEDLERRMLREGYVRDSKGNLYWPGGRDTEPDPVGGF